MASISTYLHRFASSALDVCATPMLEKAWPSILSRMLSQSCFREKSITSLLAGLRHALMVAPHQDDEFFGCPDLLLSLGEAGAKVTLAMMTDGSRQASGCSISRLDMSSNVAKLNGWGFNVMGLGDGFGDDPDVDIIELLTEFLSPYFQGDERVDLIILPAWCDYHPDHRAITVGILNVVSKLQESLHCPDLVFYWTFSAPIRFPEYARVIRISSNRWTEPKQKWMLEYGTVVSPGAADRNRLIRAAVSEACWGEIGYETVFWMSGSHVKQACLEARGGSPSCVKLNGSRIIIPNTVMYGFKAAFSKPLDKET
jgi:LmbE family N-acetylglucosaminyl deacetylase